jgi:dolichol kinase
MSNPRFALLARLLLGSTLIALLLGLWFLFAEANVVVGVVLLVVAAGDLVAALLFSRKQAG